MPYKDPAKRKAFMQRYYQENREQADTRQAERRAANPGLRSSEYQKHKEHVLQKQRRYYEENKELVNERNRRWRERNPAKKAAISKRRTIQLKVATPPWANFDAMNSIYELAHALTLETGVAHQVDHVIPIMHPLVCGLHCEANLQVLTEARNKSKGNKFDTE